MAYGHAERNLALIRQLEAETSKLLGSLNQLDPEQSAWLKEVVGPRSQAGHRYRQGGRGGQRVTGDADPGHVAGTVAGIVPGAPG